MKFTLDIITTIHFPRILSVVPNLIVQVFQSGFQEFGRFSRQQFDVQVLPLRFRHLDYLIPVYRTSETYTLYYRNNVGVQIDATDIWRWVVQIEKTRIHPN